jgi:hypothetical protein
MNRYYAGRHQGVNRPRPPEGTEGPDASVRDRRLNIRLSSKDLAIQKRALAEGLPYQTLIASLPHKYATWRLKEI